MAPSWDTDVLLETVAVNPYQNSKSSQTGYFKKEAILTSLSRKGLWHLSRTMAAQAGITNKWLSEQGLISVKEQWVKIHYPATAR